MDSYAFPWRLDFNHFIWYLASSSESSTMLLKVVQKYSNVVLLPLNIGNLIIWDSYPQINLKAD